MTSLDRLDQRRTSYRFDLTNDVPWAAANGGRYHPDALLEQLGFAAELLARADVRRSLDALLAIATTELFCHLERDVVRFVGGERARHPSTSAAWLIEEEEKHIHMFERLGTRLRAAHPAEANALAPLLAAPPSVENLLTHAHQYASPVEVAYTFWLNTLFFEEYTVFLQQALEAADAGPLDPAWAAAHRCHRQEELQHILTDAAYLEELAVDESARRSLSKSFVFFLDGHFDALFGLGAVRGALAVLHPGTTGAAGPAPTLTSLPLFREVLTSNTFKATRRAAPYLDEIARAPPPAPAALDGGAAMLAGVDDTLPARLAAAADIPGHSIWFIEHDGRESALSYAELLRAADAHLAALGERGAGPGDHVMLLTTSPVTTVPWFWACARGGLVAVPLALPSTADDAEGFRRLVRIHGQLGTPWIVADDATAALVEGALGGAGAGRVVPASARGDAARARVHRALPDDVALLQFSSGSLGDPRGVILTHRNILSDALAMLSARGGRDRETFASWMPLFHDMGLIGYHLTPVIAGAKQVLLSPLRFMREPLAWLDALTQHRATVTGAPTFALARLLPRLTADVVSRLDLRSVHTFLVGAEPIAMGVLEGFARALAPAGLADDALCPAYGLAEATLAVTMAPRGTRPRALSVVRDTLDDPRGVTVRSDVEPGALLLVDCGAAVPGVRLRVVNDAGAAVADGVVGNLELSGPTVSRGYHGESSAASGAGRWLGTGDLGFVRAGRLFVTGRKKDVFFVGGRNFYANDVEAVVRELPSVHPGAVALVVEWNEAWAVDDLALFVALKQADLPASERLRTLGDIHAWVQRRVGIAVGRVIEIDRRTVPRTTSGKLRRRGLLDRLRDGSLSDALTFVAHTAQRAPAHAPVARGDDDGIVDAVRGIWAVVLERALGDIAPETDFRALGGDSFRAVQVHDRLEKHFGATFAPEILAVGNTPARMAAFVRTALDGSARTNPTTTSQAAPGVGRRAVTPVHVDDHEAIAVVAMAVRAPGVRTPSELWRLLADGRTTFNTPPPRAALARFSALGATHASWLADVESFDPAPFGLSDVEATAMGPAQRLLLEIAFEAFAGTTLGGRRIGVFAAAGDDGRAHLYGDAPALVTSHSLLGALPNMVAARVARIFGLTGPAMTVDTACSSSLTAVHLAVQSLRAGECDAALAGGVQVGLAGELLLSFLRAGLLSASGNARPFDDDGDGLVPGEAAGCVVLKKLGRARRDGDRVLALIRGSAMNNDGGALSATAPSPRGQTEVVTQAWASARSTPAAAAFIEGHAAGTAIGDAVEVRALTNAFGAPASGAARLPCLLGSIKGNVGHTLAAAGVLSLVKAVLALEHRALPPTAGLDRVSSRADLGRALRPAMQLEPLVPRADGALRAGVSSFGLGGTNVHVVLEAAPPAPAMDAAGPWVFCVGAPMGGGAAALTRAIDVARDAGVSVPVLAAAANGYAELLPERRAVVVEDRASLVHQLTALRASGSGMTAGSAMRGHVAFVMPGPGSQIAGMGRALFAAEPAFNASLTACAAVARRHGVGLLEAMFEGTGIHTLAVAQPVVFSFAVAMAAYLESIGIRPAVLIGHSAGEYAALHLSGVLSLEDALDLVIDRGRTMAAAAPGRMAAVLAPLEDVRARVVALGTAVGIAAVNAPEQVVISGAQGAVDDAVHALSAAGLSVRALDIDCAAHSASLDDAAARFEARARDVAFAIPHTRIISTTTAAPLTHPDAAHLGTHLTAPVDFVGAVRAARGLGADVFIELAATAGLSTCVRQIADAAGDDVLTVACGARGDTSLRPAREAVASLVDAGLPVRTGALVPRRDSGASDVMPWPWRRRRLWMERPARLSESAPVLLSTDAFAAIRDHVTAGTPSAPAALLVDVIAAHATAERGAVDLADIVMLRPLLLPAGEVRALEIIADGDGRTAQTRGAGGGPATVHMSARLARRRGRTSAQLDLDEIRARLGNDVDGTHLYALLDRTGFVMGPAMRAVESVAVGEDELLARLVSPAGTTRGAHLDPALLDGASHAVAAFFLDRVGDDTPLYLGFSLERVRLHRPVQARCLAYVRLRSAKDAATLRYDISLVDDAGEVLAEIDDFAARRVGADAASTAASTAAPSAPPALSSTSVPSVVPTLVPMPASAPSTRVELVALVRRLVAERLRRSPEQIPEHAPLVRLGVDSLMAVELVRKLEQQVGVKLYATLLFEAHTVAAVAERVDALRAEASR